jgi:hypothetical protein
MFLDIPFAVHEKETTPLQTWFDAAKDGDFPATEAD